METRNLPTVHRYVSAIHRAVGSQVRIIEDLLDWSRLRMGKLTLRCEPIDLRTIVDAAEVCERIAGTGAVGAARDWALRLVASAKAGLPADLRVAQRRALELVADGVVERYS